MSLWDDYKYEYDWLDGEDDGPNYTPPPPKCKYCGSTAVSWTQEDGRWRLLNKGTRDTHMCSRGSPNDFEDLTKDDDEEIY